MALCKKLHKYCFFPFVLQKAELCSSKPAINPVVQGHEKSKTNNLPGNGHRLTDANNSCITYEMATIMPIKM